MLLCHRLSCSDWTEAQSPPAGARRGALALGGLSAPARQEHPSTRAGGVSSGSGYLAYGNPPAFGDVSVRLALRFVTNH